MKISIAKYNYAQIAEVLIAVTLCAFAILRAIVIPRLLHFLNVMQCIYVSQWKYDAANREVLHDISGLKQDGNPPLEVGITWIFEPGLNYERTYSKVLSTAPFTRNGIDLPYDYYYVTSEDSAILAKKGKKTLRYYPISGTSLMK